MTPTSRRAALTIGSATAAAALVAAAIVAASTADAATVTNIACGKAASASSNTGSAGNANDCTEGTAWQSTTTKPQQWQVDLGATTPVDHVTITWGADYATKYKIRTSSDGSNWSTKVADDYGTGGVDTLTLPTGTQTRWIQVYLSQYAGTSGFTIDEVAIYGTAGTPSPTPSSTPTASPTPTTSPTGGKTWNVNSAASLTGALAGVSPGDTISLAAGSYDGAFYMTRSGTSDKPITLTGPRSAVLSNSGGGCDPNVPSSPSGITYCGYGLHLNKVQYWHLTGFAVTNSAKGIILDGSSNNLIDGVEVSNTGDEGVHFRTASSNNTLQNALVRDTGKTQPGYGEGLYLGSAQSNWSKYGENGSGPDRSDNNKALNNTFQNVAAEHIDIKEGTQGGLVQGNTFTGGVSGANSADSWVDVKGNNYTITGNHGRYTTGTLVDGYQTHQILSPYGCGNVWRSNDSDLSNVGAYAINVTNQSTCGSNLNVVYSSNTVINATKGLTNITITAG
ncbi:discoidin domain-containing protein [Dactylosporangium sp. NPDC048998]|uniref:discoidin domain-containing protein n=1 Tax=Dactylosporangium sp. NPDC048998 TaxID=3363976 RepID=UPI0037225160